jgi:hypothetical protein
MILFAPRQHNPKLGHKPDYAHSAEAKWIDHNGGGWTWEGLCGVITHWKPLPSTVDVKTLKRELYAVLPAMDRQQEGLIVQALNHLAARGMLKKAS